MPVASPVGLIPGGRLPAVAALLTTSPSQISRTPAPATPDFHIGGPAVDSARDDSTVGGTPVQTRLTSPGKQVPSNGQQGNVQQAATPLASIARSSPKATQVYEPEVRFVEGRLRLEVNLTRSAVADSRRIVAPVQLTLSLG